MAKIKNNKKKGFYKVVGRLSKEVINEHSLDEFECVDVIQELGLYLHISKHATQFESVDNYNEAINNIPSIISSPEFVVYNKKNNSLEHYKKLSENVCVVVKITNNNELYVASLYPVKHERYESKRIKRYIIDTQD